MAVRKYLLFILLILAGSVHAFVPFCRYLGTDKGLSSPRVLAISKDAKGYMWFLTPEGLDRYDGQQFVHYPIILDGQPVWLTAEAHSLHTDSIGNIWLMAKDDTGFRYDALEDSFQPTDTRIDTPCARDFYRDEEGRVWKAEFPIGIAIYSDNYPVHEQIRNPEASGKAGNYITAIVEDAEGQLRLRTDRGVSLYNLRTGQWKNLPETEENLRVFEREPAATLPEEVAEEVKNIYTVHTSEDKRIYIGTHGSGLWIYHPETEMLENYHNRNSALLSNNIYCILPSTDPDELILSTDNELVCFHTKEKIFMNWTQEQGLKANRFHPGAGIRTREGYLVFGSDEGLILIKDSIRLPRSFRSTLVLSDFNIHYQQMKPGMEGSPLTCPIDETASLTLAHDQNLFSLAVSAINYDCPSRILYSWMMEGFYDEWTTPSHNQLIRYTGLAPGAYTLRIRAILLDDGHTMAERELRILIEPPFTQTVWAYLLYTLLLVLAVAAVVRFLWLRKDSHVSREKIRFFIRTAHDIRTPLTLILGPLHEIERNETLSPKGKAQLQAALQNTGKLTRLAEQLIDFQKAELYSSAVQVQSTEMNAYLKELLAPFMAYAREKDIQLTFKGTDTAVNAWIDTHKIDSIVHNLISNALKYTPAHGQIQVVLGQRGNEWLLTISDTGIGIPAADQGKMFRHLFRAENAVNQQITGTGIGMLHTYRLVKRHEGDIRMSSRENEGTTFQLRFPMDSRHYVKETRAQQQRAAAPVLPTVEGSPVSAPVKDSLPPQAPTLLIVEDHPELRRFLHEALADTYHIREAGNGQEALEQIAEQQPDLVISDIMMPVMRGDDLCHTLKTQVETSHIPVILLTALGDRESILHGWEVKADNYVVKPFDIDILRAAIASTLANKEFLRQRFSRLDYRTDDLPKEVQEAPGLSLDQEFLRKATDIVRQHLDESDFNVDTLCAAIGMSRSSLYHKIKALTDHSPSEFVRRIRMKEAAVLLKTRKYTVAEVSDRLGYSDPKYFTDIFKKHYGVTPSAYMKET